MSPHYSTEPGGAEASPRFHVEASFHPEPPTLPASVLNRANPHQLAAQAFAQTFGLHPAMAFLTVSLDLMLHGAAVISAGMLIPFSILGGVILGFITYKSQMKFYGDDDEAAKIKALIVALLTAVPSPLPYMLFIPAGIVGFFHRRKP